MSTSTGTFTSLTHLPNSRGELCGEGANNEGRGNLLYFDVSRCAGLRADNETCRSHQICVTDCPTKYWTYTQGKDPNLRQFCQPELSDRDWESLDVLVLVQKEVCPPYLIPSTSLNGLCLPNYALASAEEGERISTIVERIQVSNVEMLNPDRVLEGSSYSLEKVANRGFWENSLQDFVLHWKLLLLSIILSWFIFPATLALVSLLRQGLFLITVLTVAALMQVAIRSFHKYANLANQNKSIQLQLPNQINSNTWLIFALCNLIVGIIMVILYVAYFLFYECYGRDHHQPKKKLPNKSIKDRWRKAMKGIYLKQTKREAQGLRQKSL